MAKKKKADYIKRMEEEVKALRENITKAVTFHYGDGAEILDHNQKDLLSDQIAIMKQYERVLSKRIAYDTGK